jgi:hypothetical protein
LVTERREANNTEPSIEKSLSRCYSKAPNCDNRKPWADEIKAAVQAMPFLDITLDRIEKQV